MKKIENIIEICNDCQYCIKYTRTFVSTIFSVFICEHPDKKCGTLLANASSRENDINIPDNCPLENYSQTQ